MQSLGLNERSVARKRLPASALGDRADEYFCENCGRDVTKYLHPMRAHVSVPMGPERYLCPCGQKWLTGATEWDHFGGRERRKRTVGILFLSLFLSTLVSIAGFVVYLAMLRSRGALFVATIVTACSVVIIQGPFWLRVAMSIWRTRFGQSVIVGRE